MKYLLKTKIFLIFLLLIGMGACTDDFESMNIDPNQPTDVPAENILTYAIRNYADNFCDVWSIGNSKATYAGYFAKIQYIDESRYNYRESVINAEWRDGYNDLMNFQTIIDKSVEAGNPNMEAIGITMKSFLFQTLTDTWGPIPYTEALKGESGLTNPAYTSQDSIYTYLIADLKKAADLFDVANGDAIGAGDILYNGDVAKWQKFCNSLRLRVAMRISNVAPATAKGIVEGILGDPTHYPIMESNDDMCALKWTTATPYQEPFYEDKYVSNRDDHGMCVTIVDTLKSLNDPRLPVYANTASDGQYRGFIAGAAANPADMSLISRIGSKFRDEPDGLSYFMRYSEVLFDVAEAAEKGWNTGSFTAKSAYDAAITASCEENGISAADIATYLAQPSVAYTSGLTKIYLQKWIAIYKQGHEAWALTRRTDVPLMSEAPGSPYGTHNRPPFREPYPTSELNLNSAQIKSTAYYGKIVDHFWGVQMWWDTRTNVH